MSSRDTTGPLSFFDHDRQGYAGVVPVRRGNGEFLIGDYLRDEDGIDEGVGARGEFTLILHQFGRDPELSIQVCVFQDAYGALRAAIDTGLLDQLENAKLRTRSDLTELLVGLGFRDVSTYAVGSEEDKGQWNP